MQVALVYEGEKGIFIKNSTGKIYFKNRKCENNIRPGDLVSYEVVVDKEKYGFVNMTKIEKTDYDKRFIKCPAVYNKGDVILYVVSNGNEVSRALKTQIDGIEYTLKTHKPRCEWSFWEEVDDFAKKYGYEKGLISYFDTHSVVDLKWDKDKKFIINCLGFHFEKTSYYYYFEDITDIKIEKNKMQIIFSKYNTTKIFYYVFLGDGFIVTDKCSMQGGGISIKNEVIEEMLRTHTSSRKYFWIDDDKFEFKTMSEYDPDMDPNYPEWVRYEEVANQIKKRLTAKNAATLGVRCNYKAALGITFSRYDKILRW